jgi:hypothetical protein
MAAGDSIVSICNIALRALGENKIVSLTDNTFRANLCNERYDAVRREVLRAHPWNSAKQRVQLPASATPPAFGFGAAFPLPADYIRFVDLPGIRRPKFKIENGELLCDYTAPLNLLYIYDIQDPTRFDPLFVAALGYALAAEFAEPLTQDLNKQQSMLRQLTGKLDLAQLVSSQENSSEELDDDILLASRA